MLRRIEAPGAPAAVGSYSQAILDESTGLLFCSGQIGIDPATGNLVGGGADFEFRQIVANVQSILAAAGFTLADVVRSTLYLVDMVDFGSVNSVFSDFFREPFPARSTVAVSALPRGALVEWEVTAARRP
jgi:2-iminobutanoate/2-iminopropanoate deaminase